MQTTIIEACAQNLTGRIFIGLYLHYCDVHISFPVDNSAAFSPLFLKTPPATHTE